MPCCAVSGRMNRIEAVLVDPEARQASGNNFSFFTEEQFAEFYEGRVILIKRNYKLTDEDQPFSLRWFLPEFFKLRGVFGQIALTVAMITLFSLVIPLFFQIVVDKVLVNKSYNTLDVLGIGIIVVILFNGIQEFVRSYLLLFATNKRLLHNPALRNGLLYRILPFCRQHHIRRAFRHADTTLLPFP